MSAWVSLDLRGLASHTLSVRRAGRRQRLRTAPVAALGRRATRAGSQCRSDAATAHADRAHRRLRQSGAQVAHRDAAPRTDPSVARARRGRAAGATDCSANAGLGGRRRARRLGRVARRRFAGGGDLSEPARAAVRRRDRLCADQFPAAPTDLRGRDRSRAPHQGRLRLRIGGDRGDDLAGRSLSRASVASARISRM